MVENSASTPESAGTPDKHKRLKFLIIIGLLVANGAFAWIWQTQQQKIRDLHKQIADSEAQQTQPTNSTSSTPAKANWPEYVSNTGDFRVQYQPDWLLRVCEGNESTLHLAPSEKTQAVCGSEQGSPILVSSYRGDQRTDESAIPSYGRNISVKTVNQNGVSGKKISFVSDGNEFVADGTKEISYEFYTHGRTYLVHYAQAPSAQNYQELFQQIASSLIFSAN